MSHHSSDRPLNEPEPNIDKIREAISKAQDGDFRKAFAKNDLLREMQSLDAQIGPTLTHPEGKIVPHDEGGMIFGVTRMLDKVILNFGAPVSSVGFGRKEALELAKTLKMHAERIPPIIGEGD